MSKRNTVTLHHVITVYNDMFEHMDGVMRALAKKKTPWKEDLSFAVKLARQKLSKYYAEVTPTTGMLQISAHILDPFRKLRSFRKWDKGMDINPEDETSYTTQSSANKISVWAEWLRQSGRTPSEPSETPRWRITPRPASRPRVASHIALRSPFRRFFSLCRTPILIKHSGVVVNCDHTSEWVHWVRKSLLASDLHYARGA